jgi:hypothetical protein
MSRFRYIKFVILEGSTIHYAKVFMNTSGSKNITKAIYIYIYIYIFYLPTLLHRFLRVVILQSLVIIYFSSECACMYINTFTYICIYTFIIEITYI